MGCSGNSAEVKSSSDNYILAEFDVNEEEKDEQWLYIAEYKHQNENG